MEDRLLPLNNDVESEHLPEVNYGNNVSEHSISNKSSSIEYFEHKNPSGVSEDTIITCDLDLVSRTSSDQTSTNKTMPEEVDTPLYPKAESENPTIMPKKDSHSNVIHSEKINGQNEPKNIRPSSLPPDGGFQAWLVVLSSFLCNGIIFGIINSFGTVFVALEDKLKKENPNVSGMLASLVGSAAVGACFILSPVSSMLTDKYGIRKTSFVGSCLATIGMFLSAICLQYASGYEVHILVITYGILFGGGSSLVYTPSLVILGHYFRRHIGLVNGLVATGSSIFTIALPHILKVLLEEFGIPWTFGILTALVCLLMLASLSFKSILVNEEKQQDGKSDSNSNNGGCSNFWSQIVYFDNWKNRKYVIWALAVPSALFGYFVPYFHLVSYVKSIKDVIGDVSGEVLVTCIAASSGLGRIIFGKVADHSRVNPIFLQQISFICIGVCTILLTLAQYISTGAYPLLIILSLIFGLFDGCFITMFGPIAYSICGPTGASQGIGFILGMCGIPLTTGPPITGLLKDKLGNYTVAFICAGIPPLVGALLMCFIYRAKNQKLIDAAIEENNQERNDVQQDNPIIKVYTPNGHTQNNTPTMSCENSSNSRLYPNLANDDNDKHPEVPETKSLIKSS